MDPYLWTWLARYGGGCALALLWTVTAVREGVHGRWTTAVGFGALAGISGAALGTHLVPLLVGAPIPDDPSPLRLAADAPFVAFAALAVVGHPRSGGAPFDALSVAPLALWSHGAPAWLLAVVLIGRGWLAPRQPRGWLLVGLLLLTTATLADAERQTVREAAQGQGLSMDRAVQLASAVTGGLEAGGWAAITRWTVDRGRCSVGRP